jgi:hypothetical protein
MLVGASVKLALPRTACVVAFEAVTTTLCWDAMLFGAVNSPLLLTLPSAGLSVQLMLTAEGRFSTTNCTVFEAPIIAVAGLTLAAGFKLLLVAAAGAVGAEDGLTDAVEGSGVGESGAGGSGAGDGLTDPVEGSGAGGSGAVDGLTDPVEGWRVGARGAGDGLTDPVEGSGVEETGAGDGLTEPIAVPIVDCSKTVALAILVGSATLVAEIVTKVSALTKLAA